MTRLLNRLGTSLARLTGRGSADAGKTLPLCYTGAAAPGGTDATVLELHADGRHAVSAPLATARPDLGPNQLEWCSRRIKSFRAARRSARRAIEHAARVRAQSEGPPR